MMRTLTAVVPFLFFIFGLPRGGLAVSYDTLALGRVGSFALVVEAIDANSQTCGIKKGTIYNAIEYPLVGTGLQVVPTSDIYLDVAIVSSIVLARTCVTAFDLSMTAHLPVVFRGQSSVEEVLLWSSSGVFSSDVSDHASRFEETLRQQARELVVSWSGARQGRTIFDRR
jgi:hypothetical protein